MRGGKYHSLSSIIYGIIILVRFILNECVPLIFTLFQELHVLSSYFIQ